MSFASAVPASVHLAAFVGASWLYSALAALLAASYRLVGSYGAAIVLFSAIITLATFPLTAWAWRSQRARMALEPELADLRRLHGQDRAKLAADTTALYKAHGISPFSGVIPALLPLPILVAVYRVMRGLGHRPPGSALVRPKYLSPATALYRSLAVSSTIRCWGVDLGRTGLAALLSSPASAALLIGLVAVTVGAGIWQQRLTRHAVPAGPDATTGMLALLAPGLAGIWALWLPLAVTLYFATSSVIRLAQQWVLVAT